MDEYLPREYSSTDEYLPHVPSRVFVHSTNTCPIFSRVFVHGRILAQRVFVHGWILASCFGYSSDGRILAPCFWEGIRPLTKLTNTCLTNLARSQRIRLPIRIRIVRRVQFKKKKKIWSNSSQRRMCSVALPLFYPRTQAGAIARLARTRCLRGHLEKNGDMWRVFRLSAQGAAGEPIF